MNDITQEGNIAGGDFSGRDINKTNYYVNLESRKRTIERLMEEHKQAIESDSEYRDTIEALQHFMHEVSENTVAGLEPKLSAGGYGSSVEEAKQLKEMFAKSLDRNTMSEASQKIFAMVLGEVWSRFNRYVRPAMLSSATEESVDSLVYDHILDPVMELLEGNTLIVSKQEVLGMLYYLTGNCHLRWD